MHYTQNPHSIFSLYNLRNAICNLIIQIIISFNIHINDTKRKLFAPAALVTRKFCEQRLLYINAIDGKVVATVKSGMRYHRYILPHKGGLMGCNTRGIQREKKIWGLDGY